MIVRSAKTKASEVYARTLMIFGVAVVWGCLAWIIITQALRMALG